MDTSENNAIFHKPTFYSEGGKKFGQVVWAGHRISVPVDIQMRTGDGTEHPALSTLDSMISRGLLQPQPFCDSVIFGKWYIYNTYNHVKYCVLLLPIETEIIR